MRASIHLEKKAQKYIIIRDVGDEQMSVTNDAENVVEFLKDEGVLKKGQRLFYYDSNGDLDEITLDCDGNFEGFGFGFPKDLS